MDRVWVGFRCFGTDAALDSACPTPSQEGEPGAPARSRAQAEGCRTAPTDGCGGGPSGAGGGISPVPLASLPRAAEDRAAGSSTLLSAEQRRGSRPAKRHRRVLHTKKRTGRFRGSFRASPRREARHTVPGARLPPEGKSGAESGSGCRGRGSPSNVPALPRAAGAPPPFSTPQVPQPEGNT